MFCILSFRLISDLCIFQPTMNLYENSCCFFSFFLHSRCIIFETISVFELNVWNLRHRQNVKEAKHFPGPDSFVHIEPDSYNVLWQYNQKGKAFAQHWAQIFPIFWCFFFFQIRFYLSKESQQRWTQFRIVVIQNIARRVFFFSLSLSPMFCHFKRTM